MVPVGNFPPDFRQSYLKLPDGDGTLTKPSDPAPEASSQGKKCPLDADDEVVEPLGHDEAAGASQEKENEKEQK